MVHNLTDIVLQSCGGHSDGTDHDRADGTQAIKSAPNDRHASFNDTGAPIVSNTMPSNQDAQSAAHQNRGMFVFVDDNVDNEVNGGDTNINGDIQQPTEMTTVISERRSRSSMTDIRPSMMPTMLLALAQAQRDLLQSK